MGSTSKSSARTKLTAWPLSRCAFTLACQCEWTPASEIPQRGGDNSASGGGRAPFVLRRVCSSARLLQFGRRGSLLVGGGLCFAGRSHPLAAKRMHKRVAPKQLSLLSMRQTLARQSAISETLSSGAQMLQLAAKQSPASSSLALPTRLISAQTDGRTRAPRLPVHLVCRFLARRRATGRQFGPPEGRAGGPILARG